MTACQIYLVTPPLIAAPASFASELASVLDAAAVACVLLAANDVDGTSDRRAAIDVLRPVVQDRDVAFLLDGQPDLAAATGCDGVHTGAHGPPYAACRGAVGQTAIVGYDAGTSRHAALVAAEASADYIMFSDPLARDLTGDLTGDPIGELVAWWAPLMEVPCVAADFGRPETLSNLARLAASGADFLAVRNAVWAHADGPAAGIRAVEAAVRASA